MSSLPFPSFVDVLCWDCFSNLYFVPLARPKDDLGVISGVDFEYFLEIVHGLLEALAGERFLTGLGFDFASISIDFRWFFKRPSKTSRKQRGAREKIEMLINILFFVFLDFVIVH